MDFDYIAEANLTLSNKFHGQKVTMAELRGAFDDCIKAANRLDKIKKALFYGKGDDIGLTNSPGATTCLMATDNLIDDYDVDEEHAKAEILIHGAIGVFTEAGELIEALNAVIFGEAALDPWNVLEELGDCMWYQAIMLNALGSTFDTEQRRNIAKLRERFPNNFTEYDAQHRDLEAERAALEADPTVARAEAALEAAEHPLGMNAIQSVEDRMARRCPSCGLAQGFHRPDCPATDRLPI